MAKHTALRSAELALRCATQLSCRARQGIAGHGAALLSYSAALLSYSAALLSYGAAVGCWARSQLMKLRASTKQIVEIKEPPRNKSKKSWTVLQVMHGGGVEAGPPEMPGVQQPSTFSKNIYTYVYIRSLHAT